MEYRGYNNKGHISMYILKISYLIKMKWLLIGCFIIVLAAPFDAGAEGILTDTPILNNGFVLATAGSTTTVKNEVIKGNGSIKGSYTERNSYTPYIYTNPEIIKLVPGQTYTVTFQYKIIATPDKGFEVLFYSPLGGKAGIWLQSHVITGVKGETGTATLTNTLDNFTDYRINWNIMATGSIVIDDIKIINTATGRVIVKENVEQMSSAYLFSNVRTDYVLNLVEGGTDVIDRNDGTHTYVPFNEQMSFAGALKYSKDSSFIINNIRSHAESYADWNLIADLPVDFLRTGPAWAYGPGQTSGRGYSPFTSQFRFPDRADKVIVGYVNSMEFTGIGGAWDISFDPSWDMDADGLIDSNITDLPSYVDTKVINTSWKTYVAAYWKDSWKAQIQKWIDLIAVEHMDGVMFDVMGTSVWIWKNAYPAMDLSLLKQRYVELFKWASNYAKTTYGTAFMITANLDPEVRHYFPDLGRYADAGYYQNAFFRWEGSGVIDGYCLSISDDHFSNPAIDFIRNQGLSVLNMDHLGTGTVSTGLSFENYNNQISSSKFLALFNWAIQSGSTPFLSVVFMAKAYNHGFPRFARVLPNLPPLTNTPYPDWIIGSDKDDIISTGNGNDLIYGGAGNDTIEGGAGLDTAYYLLPRAKYTITRFGDKQIVKNISGSDGTDTLIDVEQLQFSDTVLNIRM